MVASNPNAKGTWINFYGLKVTSVTNTLRAVKFRAHAIINVLCVKRFSFYFI